MTDLGHCCDHTLVALCDVVSRMHGSARKCSYSMQVAINEGPFILLTCTERSKFGVAELCNKILDIIFSTELVTELRANVNTK